MSKKKGPVEAHARMLALKVRRAEDCVTKSMNDFLTAQDKRSRRRALARIRMHEETKSGFLELALRLPEDEAMEFLKHYTCDNIDKQGAKLASFANKLVDEMKKAPTSSPTEEHHLIEIAESPGADKSWLVAFCQEWEESEAGWGIRPDGFSLHVTRDDLRQYVDAYWKKMPDGTPPPEYSRPRGEPYPVRVPVQSALYADLVKHRAKFGARFFENEARPEKV